jgi:hypothetical protein
MFFLFVSECNAQEMGQWRMSHQKFMDYPGHNIQHLGTGLISFTLDNTTDLRWWQSDLIALTLGFAWEIKDGFIPYENVGYLGGEGFSWMDVRTDIYGILLNRFLNYSIKKIYFWGKKCKQ